MAAHKRSRFGCVHCKKSKVKCDEFKPKCSRCTSKSLDCEYVFPTCWMNNLNQVEYTPAKAKKPKRATGGSGRSSIIHKVQKITPRLPETTTKKAQDEKFTFINYSSGNGLKFLSSGNSVLEDFDEDIDSDEDFEEEINTSTFKEKSTSPLYPLATSPVIQIPPNLRTMSFLPLKSQLHIDAFQFYCGYTAHVVVVGSPGIYTQNPFVTILPRYALQNEGLMSILVAYGLKHKSFLNQQACPQQDVDLLFKDSKKELIQKLNQREAGLTVTDEDTLMLTGLMISSFQFITENLKNPNYLYLDLTKKMFMKKYLNFKYSSMDSGLIETNTPEIFFSSSVNHFILRWLGYVDLVVPLVSSKRLITSMRSVPMTAFWKDLARSDHCNEVDSLLGFNVAFLPLFDELIEMIVKVDKLSDVDIGFNTRSDLEFDALFWKSRISSVYEKTLNDDAFLYLNKDSALLNATNKVFYNGALIHLYRRVMKLPKDLFLVQECCSAIKETFENSIQCNSPSDSSSIFALFTAGCESLDPKSQQFFELRMRDIAYAGNVKAFKAIEIMKASWKTEEFWVDQQLEVDEFYLL